MTSRTLAALAAAVGLFLVPGCGSESLPPPADESTPIAQVGRLLRACYDAGKPAPRSFKEAEKLPEATPEALAALKSGDVVIFWGANLDEYGGASMLGFAKEARERGGPVILGDGSVAEMTAEEIRVLPHPPDALLKTGAGDRSKGSH